MSSLKTAEALLETIRAENPSFWPHGLSLNNFDTGRGEGVFLVRAKQANLAPVGFVGWQERREGGQRVGYYSIGILPEHRGHGYAKEAVQKLINIKSARVDKVVALIERGNTPSQALARSLGVTIKQAQNMFTGNVEPKLDSMRNQIAEGLTSADQISGQLSALSGLVSTAAGKADKAVRLGATGLGAGLGGAAGYFAGDLVPAGKRQKQVRALLTLLGAAGGAYAGTKMAGVKSAANFMPALKAIGRGMTGTTAQTLGAGALGAGAGVWEANSIPNSGHVSEVGLPLTNALMLMALANPRMRKDFFGAPGWKDLNTKSLANFAGTKALTLGGVIGADQTIGLMGKAQQAAEGFGDAGKALSNMSRAVEDSTRSVTSEINKAAPQIASDLTGISGNLNRVTAAAGDDSGLPSLFRGLGEAGKHLPEVTSGAARSTSNLDKVLSSADATSSALREMADAVKGLGTLKPSLSPQTVDTLKQIAGTGGGAALGGVLGGLGSRFFLDEVPAEQTKKFNRNRRLRALATLLGAGAGAYAGHKLS